MQQLLLSMMQGSYDEPNPSIVLEPSKLSNRILGRRKLIPTNRQHTNESNSYYPSLMTNLETGQLYYQYLQRPRVMKQHYSSIDSIQYDNMETMLIVITLLELTF
jgi:hypothetical protein